MAYLTPPTLGSVQLSSAAWNAVVGDILFFAFKPFISAKRTTNQSIASGVNTKVAFPTTDRATSLTLGTDGVLASSRFTPTVAGWYTITVNLVWASSCSNYPLIVHSDGTTLTGSQGTSTGGQVSAVLEFNGSTEYVEIYAAQFSGSPVNLASGTRCAIAWERFDT